MSASDRFGENFMLAHLPSPMIRDFPLYGSHDGDVLEGVSEEAVLRGMCLLNYGTFLTKT